MRASRAQLRKYWSDEARAKALAARRGQYTAGQDKQAPTVSTGETAAQAADKANAYIAAHPDQFAPKGKKGRSGGGKGKGGGGRGAGGADKAKREAERAAKEKERQAAKEQHAKDKLAHDMERTKAQAERKAAQQQKAQERAQAQAQRKAEQQAKQTERLKVQAERQKQLHEKQRAAGKAHAAAQHEREAAQAQRQAQRDAAQQARQQKETRLNTAATTRVATAMAQGGKVAPADANRLIAAGLAEQQPGGLTLTPDAIRLLTQKLAKRDISAKTRAKMDRSSFVFPDTEDFPIQKPEDVDAAVHAWGRYKGPRSFASFKRNLTRIARRKGFALPQAWQQTTEKRAAARQWEADALTKANLPNLAARAAESLKKYA